MPRATATAAAPAACARPLTLTLLQVLVGAVCSALPPNSTTPLPPDFTPGVRFNCKFSAARKLNECVNNSDVHGHCQSGEQCLARYNYFTHKAFAMCCCNMSTTPVEHIIHEKLPGRNESRWSVWITNEKPGGYCRVTACTRPWTAQECFGGVAICCPPGTGCGVSRSTGSSCYGPPPPLSPSRVSSADCCTAGVGHSCSWTNGLWQRKFWFWFPLPGLRSCCLKLEENCKESCTNSQVLLGLSVSTILVVCRLLDKSQFRRGKFRRAATSVMALLVFVFLQFVFALVNDESWLEAVIWVGCSSTALLLCRCLTICCCPTRKRRSPPPTSTTHAVCSRPTRYIAVLFVIEHYSNPAWDDVVDKSMARLEMILEAMGYTVMLFGDPAHGEFEGISKSIRSLIKGTTDSKVIIYTSCHARTIYGQRWIIPSDAGAGLFAWLQWISVDNFLRDLGENEATNPHFITLVNGCGTRCGRCDQMWWRLCHGSEDEVYTDDLDEVNVNIFYACGPGGCAFEDNMTVAFAKALESDCARDLGEIFKVMRTELRQESGSGVSSVRRLRPRQRLWIAGSDLSISLEAHQASFQSATSSSSSSRPTAAAAAAAAAA